MKLVVVSQQKALLESSSRAFVFLLPLARRSKKRAYWA
jgi:hypothetical protein